MLLVTQEKPPRQDKAAILLGHIHQTGATRAPSLATYKAQSQIRSPTAKALKRPAQVNRKVALEDAESAAEWVRSHASDLGVDADKVAVMGLSAGGHVALLTGVRRQFAAVVALYAPVLLALDAAAEGGFPARALLGDAASAESACYASPLTYAASGFPPTMFVHGTADRFVSYRPTVRMHDELVDAGVVADLHLLGGADHAFDYGSSHGEAVAELVDGFMRRNVVEPARVARETPRPDDMRAALERVPDLPAIDALRTLLERGRLP